MSSVSGEIQLLGFQQDAKDALVKLIRRRLLGMTEDPNVLLKAPTGSGKTITSGSVIGELASDSALDLCFIWLAPFKLQEQSLRSLRRVLGSSQRLSERDDLAAAKLIEQNEVVFLNWASLKDEGLLVKGSEDREAFRQICKTTRERGRQIIVVIDESHHTSDAPKAQEVKALIEPQVTFEMSATPVIKTQSSYEVPRDEVVDAGLIRKSARINDGIAARASYTDAQLDDVLLDLAVERRKKLAAAYKKAGSDVNPLLLIQIPDAKAGEEAMKAATKRLEKKHKITYATGRLGHWLSDDRTFAPDDPELINNNGKVDVLIFKQAIATGWDCPRAQVLLKLRDPGKSAKFEVQTIGRLMRMPERHHYADEDLNQAFVYHPHEKYKPAEEFAVITRTARWRDQFKRPSMKTEWFVRGETPFIEAKEAKSIAERFFKKLNVDPNEKPATNKRRLTNAGLDTKAVPDQELAEQIIKREDAKLDEIDKLADVRVGVSAKLVERDFHRLIRRWVGVAENPGLVAEYLYKFAESALGFEIPKTQAFIVANEKALDEEFVAAVNGVTPRSSRSTRERRSAEWSPPDPRPYNTEVGTKLKHEEIAELDGSAYDPCFLAVERSQPEKMFESWLSDQVGDGVAWWMKNGERGGQDFSLVYEFNGSEFNFFPDYIVGLEDGRVGLYETKDVREAFGDDENTKKRNEAKMSALREWVAEAPDERDAAFVVETSLGNLRWGKDEAPVGEAGKKMPDLLK